MYVVTNRRIRRRQSGFDILGDRPHEKGPNELRLLDVDRRDNKWLVNLLPDRISVKERKEVGMPRRGTAPRSRHVAYTLRNSLADNGGRHFLFFVHGYNNNFEETVKRAWAIGKMYNLEVIPFSWPANGGGIQGVPDYLSDKRDAQASVGAFGRCVEKVRDYLGEIHGAELARIRATAERRFPGDAERRDTFIASEFRKVCPFTVNMMLHSMGNYLLKKSLGTSAYPVGDVVFDNVVLTAADTNAEGHSDWVDRLQVRNRIYITINQDDFALNASRMKPGSEQKDRLGRCPTGLHSEKAVYVDFTGAAHVKNEHAYFEGKALENPRVKQFFLDALQGRRAEQRLEYDPARGVYS